MKTSNVLYSQLQLHRRNGRKCVQIFERYPVICKPLQQHQQVHFLLLQTVLHNHVHVKWLLHDCSLLSGPHLRNDLLCRVWSSLYALLYNVWACFCNPETRTGDQEPCDATSRNCITYPRFQTPNGTTASLCASNGDSSGTLSYIWESCYASIHWLCA